MSDTGFDETPDVTSRLLHEVAAEGLVNIVAAADTTPGIAALPSRWRWMDASCSAVFSTPKRPESSQDGAGRLCGARPFEPRAAKRLLLHCLRQLDIHL
jgi:hypothetical protein